MKLKRKKYANGTGTTGTGFVVNPNQTLSEFQLLLDNAKIEGETNVLANTIPMAASILTQFAGSYSGAGTTPKPTEFGLGGTVDKPSEEVVSNLQRVLDVMQGIAGYVKHSPLGKVPGSAGSALGLLDSFQNERAVNPADVVGLLPTGVTQILSEVIDQGAREKKMMSQYAKNAKKRNPKINLKESNLITKDSFAFGGITPNTEIEVEGDEVVEQPNSAPVEVQGPSHEQGGVDMNVDPGTKIYSDRIKLGGKTMAERKKAREDLLLNLDKTSSTRQGDEATRNSVDRMRSNVEKEEQSDLQLQELASSFQNMARQFALGTGTMGVQLPEDQLPIPSFLNNFNEPNPTIESVNSLQPVGTTYEQSQQEQQALFNTPRTIPTAQPSTTEAKTPSTGYTPTAGDLTSLFGDLYSTFAPMQNTKANRAGDTPNINAFQDFGKDALATNEDILGLVQGQAANATTRLQRSAAATKRSARNTSRSVNTQRATDTMIDLGVNAQQLDLDDNLAKQMMQILSNKSGLQNVQDQVVMGGEQQRDLADRQDRDNFYTQLAQDIATKGQGIQQTGKDLNAISQNQMQMQMLNQMSKYFQFDSKGNIIGINQAKK